MCLLGKMVDEEFLKSLIFECIVEFFFIEVQILEYDTYFTQYIVFSSLDDDLVVAGVVVFSF